MKMHKSKHSLRAIIENELNMDYMQLVRDGESPSEIASESLYFKCDICSDWNDLDDMAVTNGEDPGADICTDCINSKKQYRGANKTLIEEAKRFIEAKEVA